MAQDANKRHATRIDNVARLVAVLAERGVGECLRQEPFRRQAEGY